MTAFPEGPGASPGFLLWRVTLRWQRLIAQALRPLGLTHVQFVLLASAWWLEQHGEAANQVALAEHASVNVKMASEVLRRLADKGLVRQQADSRDGRSKVIAVAPPGAELAERAIQAVEQADREFFSAAPPDIVPALQALAAFGAPAAEKAANRPELSGISPSPAWFACA